MWIFYELWVEKKVNLLLTLPLEVGIERSSGVVTSIDAIESNDANGAGPFGVCFKCLLLVFEGSLVSWL